MDAENWLINRGYGKGTNYTKEMVVSLLEYYHQHKLESVSEEDIERHFNNELSSWGQPYTVSPIQYMVKGAKWLLNHLKNR